MSERAYFDKSLNKNADEHLEICFKQIFEGNIKGKEGKAIAKLLDPYTQAMYGDDAIMFVDSLTNLDSAIKWATQIGPLLLLWDADKDMWHAKIGSFDHGDHTEHQCMRTAIILAGVQVLRETAFAALASKPSTELSH